MTFLRSGQACRLTAVEAPAVEPLGQTPPPAGGRKRRTMAARQVGASRSMGSSTTSG